MVKLRSGKRVVLWFYGSMFGLALIGIIVIAIILRQPVAEREQKNLARLMSNAYQKYWLDEKTWAPSAEEAAINFHDENPELLQTVKKARKEWGFREELTGTEGTEDPRLTIRFSKPHELEMNFSLSRRTRSPRR